MLPEFNKLNASIVAISVDNPAQNRKLVERLKLSFDLYSDQGGLTALEWGVFDAKSGYNLAATFVIAKGGEVVHRYLGTGKKDRPKGVDLLKIVTEDGAGKPTE